MKATASVAQRWLKATLGRGWVAWLLLPVTTCYALLWWCRRWLWHTSWRRSHRLPVPVVVVGNVVVGGAGKTPATLAILRHLVQQGFRPAVVSRGYGRSDHDIVEVHLDTPATISGDEPLLIRQASGVPVFVGQDRVAAGQMLLKNHPNVNVIVCDDGLQHWRLHRDIAIAVFDERGVGNGWLLPSGLLREPWPIHHRFAPHMLLQQHTLPHHRPPLPNPKHLPTFSAGRRLSKHATNLQGHTRSTPNWAHSTCSAISGIAQPERFFDMLRHAGIAPTLTVALPDHAPAATWMAALAQVQGDVMCTEKDAVKLRGLLPAEDASRVWVVGLELDIPDAFMHAITERLQAFGRV